MSHEGRPGFATRYVREIERYWVERLDRPVVLSPKEWALITDWHARGIPLQIVFEAIDAAFDREVRRRGRRRPPRSLAFVAPAVDEAWQVILEGRSVGEHPRSLERDPVEDWRTRLTAEGPESDLGRLLGELLARRADGARGGELDRRLEQRLPDVVSAALLSRVREQVERALRPFAARLDTETLASTRRHALIDALRRELCLPRLRSGEVDC